MIPKNARAELKKRIAEVAYKIRKLKNDNMSYLLQGRGDSHELFESSEPYYFVEV